MVPTTEEEKMGGRAHLMKKKITNFLLNMLILRCSI